MKIELYGVEVFGYHGATEVEEREGQTFLFDVALWPRQSRTPTTSSTRSTTARWRRASVRVFDRERVRLLETLAASPADELISRFAVERSVCACASRRSSLDPPSPSIRPSPSNGRDHDLRRARLELGDREHAIRSAAELIGATRLSEIRETEPWGYEDQPHFLNAVAEVETELGPREPDSCSRSSATRPRAWSGSRYGPRTIDLDLLLYGEETIDEPGLTVPHPRLHERRFVLEPLADLEPALVVPGHGTVGELLAALH